MPAVKPRRRALISAYDKSGVADLAAGLAGLGWELLASGGTARVLAEAGLAAVDVAEHTGWPAILGHRVVTLHPRIHGGILADRDDPSHRADLEAGRIAPIDLVVVNLYPFEARPGVEAIDIGGPALLRAAAKNCAHVGAVADPRDYAGVLAELADRGWLSAATRRGLARTAFAHASAHDAAVIAWLDSQEPEEREEPEEPADPEEREEPADPEEREEPADPEEPADAGGGGPLREAGTGTGEEPELPRSVHLVLEKAETLRYGENPDQRAARYRRWGRPGFFDGVLRRGGPALSHLNLADAHAAWALALELGGEGLPAAVIVKHANPCGAAAAASASEAYRLALECDPRSAFGGVVAVSAEIDGPTAAAMVGAAQADVVIAPGYAPGVLERLRARRAATRLLEAPAPPGAALPDSALPGGGALPGAALSEEGRGLSGLWELRGVGGLSGDFVVQDRGRPGDDPGAWPVVTERVPTPAERADAAFAWRVCAAVASNAVVLARGGVAWGIGAGQQNRADAGRLAEAKASGRAAGGACASDGFYPFPDGIRAAADAGAAVVVQPGGSVNDATVIAAADRLGLAMLFTGRRRFRH